MNMGARFGRISILGFSALIAALSSAASATAEEKITCVLPEFEYQSLKKDALGDSKLIGKFATQVFKDRLEKSGKFEIESRDESKLPPGGKFKNANCVLIGNLNAFPKGDKEVNLILDARIVKLKDEEILGVGHGQATVGTPVSWPDGEAEFSSDKFRESALGSSFVKAVETAADGLIGDAASILSRSK